MSPRWKPLPGDRPDPRPISASLERVVPKVFSVWAEVVGEGLSEHTRPRALHDGTLVVVVDEPAWATQLRWLEADLLVRLGEALGPGQVERIEVQVRGSGAPPW